MGIVMGPNQFGKAEVRCFAVDRSTATHQIRDLKVGTSLRGDFEETHLTGDNAKVLTTDAQKNTVFAFAKQGPIGAIEDFGRRLGRHFTTTQDPVQGCRVLVDEYAWGRIPVNGTGHHYSFHRTTEETRTTAVTFDNGNVHVVSGLKDLTVLKTTGSEFWGYPKDQYTTLPEVTDRILATAVSARWRYLHNDVIWDKTYDSIRTTMLEAFATTHSYALQQSLYEMGKAVLEKHPEVAEMRLSLPNKHHFLYDLEPFGMENNNEVFFAADRPYGLIEGTVKRDDVDDCPQAWYSLDEF